VRPDQLTIGGADFLVRRHVFLLLEHIPGHAHDVLWPGVGLGQHLDDIPQRLPHLAGEVIGVEHPPPDY
jgi:hypothetical protein